MKYFLFCSFLLFLALGCKKDNEVRYAVNFDCGYIEYDILKKVLVVTNAEGEVLETFEVPKYATTFSKEFSLSAKNPPEQYDLHLVHLELQDIFGPDTVFSIRIFSHFDVPNGALVNFKPEPTGPSPFGWRIVMLHIRDVESYDSLDYVGFHQYYNPVFNPAEKRLDCSLQFGSSQSLLLRLRANNEPQFRYCFIPDTLVSDTMSVSWQNFKPETNLKSLEVPNSETYFVRFYAVSPDFKHYTMLYFGNYWLNGGLQSLAFNLPDELPEPVTYAVYAQQNHRSFEQIFQPGEPLRLEPSDMEIGDFSVSREKVSIESSGDIDLLSSYFSAYQQGERISEVLWRMDGKPESFKNHALPRLQEYLPAWYDQPTACSVSALQFDTYDYPQVREGFPFKSNEPFAVARSGHKAIWKEN